MRVRVTVINGRPRHLVVAWKGGLKLAVLSSWELFTSCELRGAAAAEELPHILIGRASTHEVHCCCYQHTTKTPTCSGTAEFKLQVDEYKR